MPVEIRLPQLAESMESAKLVVWLKHEGDRVEAGQAVAEIETDKTNVELEAPASGVLQKIHVPAGTDGLSIGQLLAVIQDVASSEQSGTNTDPHADAVENTSHDLSVKDPRSFVISSVGPRTTSMNEPRPAQTRDPEVAATPLARQMAALRGLDLAQIRGSGPKGRIGKQDIERALRERRGPQPASVRAESAAAQRGTLSVSEPVVQPLASFEERPLTAIRKITAARLLLAKQTIPHFYLQIDCATDGLLDVRASLNSRSSDLKCTITDFVVRGAALALRKVPLANSTWAENAVRLYETCDIAVAVNTPAGVITPIVRRADGKGLAEISRELKALTDRARSGQLRLEEYTGGTFTISNLGMYGVSSLYAIVNPPQSCILGVGATGQRPVVRDGQLRIGNVMTCTLSADHRAIDGATGAELLAEFRRLIEEPWLLMV